MTSNLEDIAIHDMKTSNMSGENFDRNPVYSLSGDGLRHVGHVVDEFD